jgi:hypothetical protein
LTVTLCGTTTDFVKNNGIHLLSEKKTEKEKMWAENELLEVLTDVVDDPETVQLKQEVAKLKQTLKEKDAELTCFKRALQLSVPITVLVPLYKRQAEYPYTMQEKDFHAWQNRELWRENTYLHAFMRQMGVVL